MTTLTATFVVDARVTVTLHDVPNGMPLDQIMAKAREEYEALPLPKEVECIDDTLVSIHTPDGATVFER